jgi:hypothetical protein
VVAALTFMLAAGLGGCGDAEEPTERPGAPDGQPAPARAAEFRPPPDERLPSDARLLARRLTRGDAALGRSVARWRSEGDPSREVAPDAVVLQALHQQRVHRFLARRPRLAQRTFARLSPRLARSSRETHRSLRDLGRLSPPAPARHVRRIRTGPPLPPDRLMAHYRAAQRRFGVGWHVLAAVNLVESAFGRMRNESTAGARGPMQFMPATWRAYGMGGDVRVPRDAIMGAANYLRASGAPRNYRRALYAYNHSWLYVDAVLRYARQMARSPRAFYAFHSWQAFVRTPSGDRRLTGPGRDWRP